MESVLPKITHSLTNRLHQWKIYRRKYQKYCRYYNRQPQQQQQILNLSMVSYIVIKKQKIPRLAIFLDFEKAFDAIE